MRRKQRPQRELAGGDLCELDRVGTAVAPEARRQPGGWVGAQQEDDDFGTEPGGRGLSFGKARAKAEPTSKWERVPRGPPGPGCQGGLSQSQPCRFPKNETVSDWKPGTRLGLPAVAPSCQAEMPSPHPPSQGLLRVCRPGLRQGDGAALLGTCPGVTAESLWAGHAHLPVSTWLLLPARPHLPLGLLARDAVSHLSVIL